MVEMNQCEIDELHCVLYVEYYPVHRKKNRIHDLPRDVP